MASVSSKAVNKKGHIKIKQSGGKLVLSLRTTQPSGLLAIQPAVVSFYPGFPQSKILFESLFVKVTNANIQGD